MAPRLASTEHRLHKQGYYGTIAILNDKAIHNIASTSLLLLFSLCIVLLDYVIISIKGCSFAPIYCLLARCQEWEGFEGREEVEICIQKHEHAAGQPADNHTTRSVQTKIVFPEV